MLTEATVESELTARQFYPKVTYFDSRRCNACHRVGLYSKDTFSQIQFVWFESKHTGSSDVPPLLILRVRLPVATRHIFTIRLPRHSLLKTLFYQMKVALTISTLLLLHVQVVSLSDVHRKRQIRSRLKSCEDVLLHI